MIIPPEKKKRIDVARKEIDKVEDQFRKGIITRGERHNKIIDVWTSQPMTLLKKFSSLWMKIWARIRLILSFS